LLLCRIKPDIATANQPLNQFASTHAEVSALLCDCAAPSTTKDAVPPHPDCIFDAT
jgi:hypothetical protein